MKFSRFQTICLLAGSFSFVEGLDEFYKFNAFFTKSLSVVYKFKKNDYNNIELIQFKEEI